MAEPGVTFEPLGTEQGREKNPRRWTDIYPLLRRGESEGPIIPGIGAIDDIDMNGNQLHNIGGLDAERVVHTNSTNGTLQVEDEAVYIDKAGTGTDRPRMGIGDSLPSDLDSGDLTYEDGFRVEESTPATIGVAGGLDAGEGYFSAYRLHNTGVSNPVQWLLAMSNGNGLGSALANQSFYIVQGPANPSTGQADWGYRLAIPVGNNAMIIKNAIGTDLTVQLDVRDGGVSVENATDTAIVGMRGTSNPGERLQYNNNYNSGSHTFTIAGVIVAGFNATISEFINNVKVGNDLEVVGRILVGGTSSSPNDLGATHIKGKDPLKHAVAMAHVVADTPTGI